MSNARDLLVHYVMHKFDDAEHREGRGRRLARRADSEMRDAVDDVNLPRSCTEEPCGTAEKQYVDVDASEAGVNTSTKEKLAEEIEKGSTSDGVDKHDGVGKTADVNEDVDVSLKNELDTDSVSERMDAEEGDAHHVSETCVVVLWRKFRDYCSEADRKEVLEKGPVQKLTFGEFCRLQELRNAESGPHEFVGSDCHACHDLPYAHKEIEKGRTLRLHRSHEVQEMKRQKIEAHGEGSEGSEPSI